MRLCHLLLAAIVPGLIPHCQSAIGVKNQLQFAWLISGLILAAQSAMVLFYGLFFLKIQRKVLPRSLQHGSGSGTRSNHSEEARVVARRLLLYPALFITFTLPLAIVVIYTSQSHHRVVSQRWSLTRLLQIEEAAPPT